jgi:hypothetical protein
MAAQSVPVTPSALLGALSALRIADPNTATSNTATSDNVISTTADLQLPNFPIPRELRDQIYGYLLHSDYVRVARERKTAPGGGEEPFSRQAYKFHTNILAVNKTIHDEAEEYLYKNNVFVVASAEWHEMAFWPGQWLLTRNMWTPTITEKGAAKMRHHSVRLHFTRGQTAESNYMEACGVKSPLRSCLILAKDLEALRSTVSIQILDYEGFAVVIEDDPPGGLNLIGWNDFEDKPHKPTRLQVKFFNTRYRTGDVDMQHSILNTLRKITCPAMRVSFDGILPAHTHLIQQIKDTMSPILLSRRACDWIRFESLREAKELVDASLRGGELQLAEEIYTSIMQDTTNYLHVLAFPPQPALLRLSWPSIKPLWALRLDIALTLGFLQIKLGNLQELYLTTRQFKTHAMRAGALVSDFPPVSSTSHKSMEDACGHFGLLSDLYLEKFGDRKKYQKISVARAMEILSKFKSSPYVQHDYAILSMVRKNKNTKLASAYLPRRMCSVSVLGPPIFSYHRSPGVPRKPDEMVGLQNPDVLSRLDHNTKMQINDLQRLHQQKVTEWE